MTPEEIESIADVYEDSISKDARVIRALLAEIERLQQLLEEATG